MPPVNSICRLLFGAILTLSFSALADDRPNIVLLMGDDHGWDETGYNGHPWVQTPVLDEMAAGGLRLDRFYSAHPTCSPTRGSVMTGRHPNRYGTFTPNFSIRPQEITIAQLLTEAGYACGHFGKWHLGPVKAASPTSPGAMGFEQWTSHDNFFEFDPPLSRNGAAPVALPGEGSAVIVSEALKFIEHARRRDRPFLVVVWFASPHEPYRGLPQDLELYNDLPAEWATQSVRVTSHATGRSTSRPRREVLQERYAEITAMDRSIGMLRNWLEKEQLRENTLLWYCGDNGTPPDGIVTSPFRGHKGAVYDGGIRVPGLIEWPAGLPTARSSRVNTVTSDILPTVCGLAEVALPPRPLDGIDLDPILRGQLTERPQAIGFWKFNTKRESSRTPWLTVEQQQGTTPLVKKMGNIYTRNFRNFHHTHVSEQDYFGPAAWLTNDYKLVTSAPGDSSVSELYSVDDDPAESRNLADRRPDIVTACERDLRNWQTSVLHSLTGGDYQSEPNRVP